MKTLKQLNEEARRLLLSISGKTYKGKTFPKMKVPKNPKLLSTSYKVEKGRAKGIKTSILYLSPSDSSGITLKSGKLFNSCPFSSDGCRSGCLGTSSGQMRFFSSFNSRAWKTALYLADFPLFKSLILKEVEREKKSAEKEGLVYALRLDGTSDLGISERLKKDIPQGVKLYEYTKDLERIRRAKGDRIHYTFSASEKGNSQEGARLAREKGFSTAAIVPKDFGGSISEKYSLIHQVYGSKPSGLYLEDGDTTDARFLDNSGSLVFLKVKGGKKVEKALGGMVFNV